MKSLEFQQVEKKTVLMFFGNLILLVSSFSMIINPDFFARSGESHLFVTIFGIFGACFFGLTFVNFLRFAFGRNTVLILNEKGIFDNSNANSLGWIYWEDIVKFKKVSNYGTQILLVYTNNPQKYIDRAKSSVSRKILEVNYRTYGTPVSVGVGILDTDFKKLEKLIRLYKERSIAGGWN